MEKKHKLREGDIVRYTEDGEVLYLCVDCVADGTISGWSCSDLYYGEWIDIPEREAVYCPTVTVDEGLLKQYVQYEITGKKLCGKVETIEQLSREEPYSISPEELLEVLKKAGKVGAKRFRSEWLEPAMLLTGGLISVGIEEPVEKTDGYRFIPSEENLLYDIWDEILEQAEENLLNSKCIAGFAAALENLIAMREMPVSQRKFGPEYILNYVNRMRKNEIQVNATEAELALYRQYTEMLCNMKHRAGMEAKAYSCYGGDRAYQCDWITSRNLLLELMQELSDPFYANTLGYIYYYGRCNDGVPEYDKAIYYFSIGAAGGVFESRYKLADMFRNGYGVTKNTEIASKIVNEVYNENLKRFIQGEMDNKLADAALRLGNYWMDDDQKDADQAFIYYLQAAFAIRIRRMNSNYYGDEKVEHGIRNALQKCLPETSYEKPVYTLRAFLLEWLLKDSLEQYSGLEMILDDKGSGRYSARIRVIPKDCETFGKRIFITFPEAHFCGFMDEIRLQLEMPDDDAYILNEDRDRRIKKQFFEFDAIDGNRLLRYGRTVAVLNGIWTLKLKKPQQEKVLRMASVCYPGRSKQFDCLCDITDVKPGDTLNINGQDGKEDVTVIDVFELKESELPLPKNAFNKLSRTEA